MATGPEHYRKAEVYLTTWMHSGNAESLGGAQVHAILALAAATAMATYSGGEMDARDYYAWHAVAGVKGEYTTAQEDAPTPSPLSSTPLAVAFGAAVTEDKSLLPWERELLARTDVEHLTAEETSIRAAAWSAEAAAEDDGVRADWEREMPDLAEDDPARLPVEYFDAAEAADVRQIERELDVWAGDDSEVLRQEAEDDARAVRAATGSDETWERNDEWTAKGEL